MIYISVSQCFCLCDNCVFLPRLFVDIIYMIGYFSMQMDRPECVPSVQCPFYIVLLITQLLKQCNVKRALARDFSQRQGQQRGQPHQVLLTGALTSLHYCIGQLAVQQYCQSIREQLCTMFESFQRGTPAVSSGIWLFVFSVLQVIMSNPNSWDPISIASAVHCVQSSAILLIGFQVLGCSLIQMGH